MADVVPTPSDVSEAGESIETGSQPYEPAQKKQRKDEGSSDKRTEKVTDERLETRLGGILCCSVCLDLPSSAVYQVNASHLVNVKLLFVKKLYSSK